MTIDAKQAREVWGRAECLFDESQVMSAFNRMAKEISDVLAEKEPVILSVMNGGLIPTGHLLTRLDFPLHVDYLHASRYRGATRGGALNWTVKPQQSLKNRAILIIDDILDEGLTLESIIDYCHQKGAASVHSCVLVEKMHQRKEGSYQADFIGLQVNDVYVFGFGMDYKGYLRNAPGIYAVAAQDDN